MKRTAWFLVVGLAVVGCKREAERSSLAEQEKERRAQAAIPDLTEPEHAPAHVKIAEAAAAAPQVPTPEAIRKLHEEPLAGLKLGMTSEEVLKILGKPTKQTSVAPLGNAKEEIGMTWTWPTAKGEFAGAAKTTTFTLRTITFTAASKLKTSRGVGIGSTRAEVAAAYPGLVDLNMLEEPKFLVIGVLNHYGLNGLSFTFRAPFEERDADLATDRVKEIEWAGGAEP